MFETKEMRRTRVAILIRDTDESIDEFRISRGHKQSQYYTRRNGSEYCELLPLIKKSSRVSRLWVKYSRNTSSRITNEFPVRRVTIHQRVNYANEMRIMRVSTIRAACIDLSFLEPENQGLRSRSSLALRTARASSSDSQFSRMFLEERETRGFSPCSN